MKNEFSAYEFVRELNTICDDNTKNNDGSINYAYSYGRFVGFFTFALSNLDLNERQIQELNRMLEVSRA
jgi:hypothetical protein